MGAPAPGAPVVPTPLIYTKCQNVNRRPSGSSASSTTKRPKVTHDFTWHSYPSLSADCIDDDTAHGRNMALLKQESAKTKPNPETAKLYLAVDSGLLSHPPLATQDT